MISNIMRNIHSYLGKYVLNIKLNMIFNMKIRKIYFKLPRHKLE